MSEAAAPTADAPVDIADVSAAADEIAAFLSDLSLGHLASHFDDEATLVSLMDRCTSDRVLFLNELRDLGITKLTERQQIADALQKLAAPAPVEESEEEKQKRLEAEAAERAKHAEEAARLRAEAAEQAARDEARHRELFGELARGQIVRLSGLKARPELNGLTATLESFVFDSGRVNVKVEPTALHREGEMIALWIA